MNKSVSKYIIFYRYIFFAIIGLFAIMAVLKACKDDDGTSPASLAYAASCGHRDALEALQQEEGTMAREGAILAIRARETAIRDAGYEECADSYARAAEETLFSGPAETDTIE